MSGEAGPLSSTTVAPGAADHPPKAVRWDRYRGRPELYVESDRVARAVAGIAAVLIVLTMIPWIREAVIRLDVPEFFRPAWFRWAQLLVALAGILAALVEAVYLVHYTLTELVWRRWRGVTIVFAVLASTSTALWLVDRYLLDYVFLG